jgi:hypothetical protein
VPKPGSRFGTGSVSCSAGCSLTWRARDRTAPSGRRASSSLAGSSRHRPGRGGSDLSEETVRAAYLCRGRPQGEQGRKEVASFPSCPLASVDRRPRTFVNPLSGVGATDREPELEQLCWRSSPTRGCATFVPSRAACRSSAKGRQSPYLWQEPRSFGRGRGGQPSAASLGPRTRHDARRDSLPCAFDFPIQPYAPIYGTSSTAGAA